MSSAIGIGLIPLNVVCLDYFVSKYLNKTQCDYLYK